MQKSSFAVCRNGRTHSAVLLSGRLKVSWLSRDHWASHQKGGREVKHSKPAGQQPLYPPWHTHTHTHTHTDVCRALSEVFQSGFFSQHCLNTLLLRCFSRVKLKWLFNKEIIVINANESWMGANCYSDTHWQSLFQHYVSERLRKSSSASSGTFQHDLMILEGKRGKSIQSKQQELPGSSGKPLKPAGHRAPIRGIKGQATWI